MTSTNYFRLLCIVATWIATTALAAAAPVAIVTDLTGRVSLAGHPNRALNILSEMDAGAVVKAEAGSRVILVYLKSGDEYEIVGPSEQTIANDKPEAKSGSAANKRGPALRKQLGDMQIRTSGLAQAAVVMRTLPPGNRIKLVTLSSTQTLDARPEFRWNPVPGVSKYHFELMDRTGRHLITKDVGENSVQTPADSELADGGSYTWTLSGTAADGQKYSASAKFSSALPEIKRQVEALRPGQGAETSELVTFAIWLEQKDLRDEARKYWKMAASKRGNEPRLAEFAEE